MKDSSLRLQDKTVLLVGPFNGITQACLRGLTEYGCDVAYVDDQSPNASRYAEGINEAREVHAHYGRAAHFNLPVKSVKDAHEALGRVTESLGRIDVLVDATPLAWNGKTDAQQAVELCATLAESCAPFFMAKQRGRMIFIFEDTCLEKIVPNTATSGGRDMLLKKLEKLARQFNSKNVTANGISIGVTDDFLLRNFPQSPSIKKSLEELQKDHPQLRLIEYHDIALGAAYFASALSAAVTGQVLRLTQGYHLD